MSILFFLIGLKGCYEEDVYEAQTTRVFNGAFTQDITGAIKTETKRWTAPWFRRFPAKHIHNLRMVDGGTAWTLVWTGKEERMWGFWKDLKKWVDYRTYIEEAGGEV